MDPLSQIHTSPHISVLSSGNEILTLILDQGRQSQLFQFCPSCFVCCPLSRYSAFLTSWEGSDHTVETLEERMKKKSRVKAVKHSFIFPIQVHSWFNWTRKLVQATSCHLSSIGSMPQLIHANSMNISHLRMSCTKMEEKWEEWVN